MSDETQAGAPEVRAGQRIAKVMARAGVCSRREAEAWIAEGRVSVNGKVLLSPAFNVSEADDVRVDGKPLAAPERTRLFLFHKPKGLVTTARDPEGRPTVFSALPPDLPRLVAIGRLDINTEGLLLLTNDGGLARVLELPSTGWLRRYRVRAHGSIDQAALDRLSDGVTIDGVDYQGVEAKLDREQGSNAWLTLGLREGKNREIKKILEHLGLAVNRLIRISFGPFELGDLPEREVMEVRSRVLRDQLGAKLAREANANFDAPLTVRDEPPPEPRQGERPRSERGRRESVAPKRRMQGGSDRGAKGGASRFERDGAARPARLKPSTPERRRKHVSALRAEIAADASAPKGPRKRLERSATQDRKGRTVAVERRSRDHGATSGLPGREPPERGHRPTPFKSKAGRDGKGRERIGAAHRSETAPRGAFKPSAERDERPKGRKSDDRKGERSGSRDAPRREGDNARRSERDPRPDFKPRGGGPAQRNGSPGSRAVGRPDKRSGRRPDDNRGARGKPSRAGAGRGKGPPSGQGPRRPPRKS
jgi:23S rRNA pseudouridine2605 synthase